MENDFQFYEQFRDLYYISTNPSLLDLDSIHSYLERSYWSPGVPKERVALAIEHSLCFGMFHTAEPGDIHAGLDQTKLTQVGFARVVTDRASFAYLADVYVLPAHQGQGLGVWLIDAIINCPLIEGIRSFFLATRDAHGLYAKFGFEIPASPDRIMIKRYELPWYKSAMAEN